MPAFVDRHTVAISYLHLLASGRIHSSERRSITKGRETDFGYESRAIPPLARDYSVPSSSNLVATNSTRFVNGRELFLRSRYQP